jgi:diguanylate cyclase (GGDEF)-like protein/PAS domain S-box-containing protein
MDEKTNLHDLLLEVESLRKELHSVTQNRENNLIYKKQLDAILDNAPVEIYLKDREGRYTRINKQFEKLFGVKNEDLVGMLPADVHGDDPNLAASTRDHDLFVLNSGKAEWREEIAELVTENQPRTFLTIKFPIFDGNGEVDGLGAIVTDISENVEARKMLQSHTFFKQAESMGNIGHFRWDLMKDKLISCSDQYARIYGMTVPETLEHFISTEAAIELVHPDDKELYRQVICDSNLQSKGFDSEYRIIHSSGDIRHVYTLSELVLDNDGVPSKAFATIQDITERKQVEEKLKRVAHYDLLTNLPNRVLLAGNLRQSMVQCQRRNRSLAVAFLDLDGFKTVNDVHGHGVGDELLVSVSQRMKAALREGDTLARIGGDEFIAVMIDLEKIEDSETILERLLMAAAEPVTVGDAVIQVSASIGVTLYPQDGIDADQLIRHADQAMYIAKQAGKNRYHLFDTAQDNELKMQREGIGDIRSALDRREFVLHYQPKVNMNTGEVVGVEALIRWQHPERGLVPPLAFLPGIEGHAISLELGEWVIDTALSQITQWRNIGLKIPISVNISPYQLQQANFTTRLAALLAAHPEVKPHYLELEILETGAFSDIDQVSATMKACHDLGVHFALDDFGTGYSSLTHLRRLPAHLIKIDQSFVRDMLKDAGDLAIIEGVVGLAKALKREVIAEGVETIDHGVALLKLGCELAQGYGIARPMPADDIPKWSSSWKADDAWQGTKSDRG